jgi:hypothetical protein
MTNDGGIQYQQQLGQQENDPEYWAWQEARERERNKELGIIPRRMPGIKAALQQKQYDEDRLYSEFSTPTKFL